jgi:tetratricopeptide (TPR) repeat protein
MVEDLIRRIQAGHLAQRAEEVFQLAVSQHYLGRIHYSASRPSLALEPLAKAIEGFEQLGDALRDNLSAAFGDQANALMSLGRLDEALVAAERGLTIDRELGHDREIAAGLGQTAAILMEQQRYNKADTRYTEALDAAKAVGDLELQATFLQHQGILHRCQDHLDHSVELFQQAMALFQRAGDKGGEMETCDLLASAEVLRNHLDAAESWYGRSRELALERGDRAQLAATAQNLGILYQTRAEGAEDVAQRDAYLCQAITFVEESLAIEFDMGNQVGAASSHFQLSVLYWMLGDLDHAEEHAMQALNTFESLNLPNVWKDYSSLADIARDRGDTAAAETWQTKYDAKLAEVKRLRRGPDGAGAGATPDDATKAILALAQAAHAARFHATSLPLEVAEALAQLASFPAPVGAIGTFLERVADPKAPLPNDIPPGLPAPLTDILTQLLDALKK